MHVNAYLGPWTWLSSINSSFCVDLLTYLQERFQKLSTFVYCITYCAVLLIVPCTVLKNGLLHGSCKVSIWSRSRHQNQARSINEMDRDKQDGMGWDGMFFRRLMGLMGWMVLMGWDGMDAIDGIGGKDGIDGGDGIGGIDGIDGKNETRIRCNGCDEIWIGYNGWGERWIGWNGWGRMDRTNKMKKIKCKLRNSYYSTKKTSTNTKKLKY